MPSGTDGGRKHPTRTPSSRHLPAAETARLRLTARADLSDADLARASDVLAQVLGEHGHPVGAAARLEGARA